MTDEEKHMQEILNRPNPILDVLKKHGYKNWELGVLITEPLTPENYIEKVIMPMLGFSPPPSSESNDDGK